MVLKWMFVMTDIWMTFYSVCSTVKSIRDVRCKLMRCCKKFLTLTWMGQQNCIITIETFPVWTKHSYYTGWIRERNFRWKNWWRLNNNEMTSRKVVDGQNVIADNMFFSLFKCFPFLMSNLLYVIFVLFFMFGELLFVSFFGCQRISPK